MSQGSDVVDIVWFVAVAADRSRGLDQCLCCLGHASSVIKVTCAWLCFWVSEKVNEMIYLRPLALKQAKRIIHLFLKKKAELLNFLWIGDKMLESTWRKFQSQWLCWPKSYLMNFGRFGHRTVESQNGEMTEFTSWGPGTFFVGCENFDKSQPPARGAKFKVPPCRRPLP